MRKKLPQKCKKCAESSESDLIGDISYEFFSCEICKKTTKLAPNQFVPKICYQCAAENKQCGYCCDKIVKVKPINLGSIVKRIVLAPAKCDKFFWSREVNFLNRLLIKYPDIKFWQKSEIKRVNSLIAFLSSDSVYLDKQYKSFHYVVPTANLVEIKIGEKCGEDYNKEHKIRTVKDLFKL